MRGDDLGEDGTKFVFADLFAGIGGMRLGFEKEGGECSITSEIDTNALRTYFCNFPDVEGHTLVKDVGELTLASVPANNRDLDVLVAGFPCQPYSIAGLRKGLKDTRGGEIFIHLLRILKDFKPRAFLLENVRGIASHDAGRTLGFMIESLEDIGYHTAVQTLNSMSHANVPQNRARVFIAGFRETGPWHQFEFPGEIPLTTRIQDCLQPTEEIPERFYYDERFPAFQQIRSAVVEPGTFYQWRRQYVRQNKSSVCPTLTANMGSGGHNVPLLLDERGVRKLTPRETANFQGFPKSFVLPQISDGHLYHQFGNSVTVPLIERLSSSIYLAIAS